MTLTYNSLAVGWGRRCNPASLFLTLKVVSALLFIAPAFAQSAEFSTGKSYYESGDYRTAIVHFKLASKADPRSAECNYWIGRSYETLADLSTPFGRKYRSLARTYLTNAAEQAPNRPDYRRELFEFLLDTNQQRRAGQILELAESDPEYDLMRSRFRETHERNTSLDFRICQLFQLVTAWR